MKLKVDHVVEAAEALSDLNIFAAVATLMESGLNHSPTYSSASRIISIAKVEQDRCLRRYDKHRAALAKVGK